MNKGNIVLPVLDEKQKTYISENWHKQDVKTLTQNVFSNAALTLRDAEAKTVKAYLAEMGKMAPKTEGKRTVELDENQKEYIRNNYENSSGALELTKVLFGNDRLTFNTLECRAVAAYIKLIDPNFKKEDDIVEGEYKAPVSIIHLIGRVNKYAIAPKNDGRAMYDQAKLTPSETKNLQALLSYMNQPLFKAGADKYIKKNDLELFESTFVSHCWNKPELMAEEVHQYISLADETVKLNQIDRLIQKLDDRLHSMLDDEDAPIRQAEVELLNSVREKANASKKQIAALVEALIGKRSAREKNKIESNASMHNLVSAWKEEENRKKIIQMNEKRQKAALKVEIERLSDMDSLKAEIFGLNKENLLK